MCSPRCDTIHEADRILRAKSDLGVSCAEHTSRYKVGRLRAIDELKLLYNAAEEHLTRNATQQDPQHVGNTLRRLQMAYVRMRNEAIQTRVRRECQQQGYEVTNELTVPVDVEILER